MFRIFSIGYFTLCISTIVLADVSHIIGKEGQQSHHHHHQHLNNYDSGENNFQHFDSHTIRNPYVSNEQYDDSNENSYNGVLTGRAGIDYPVYSIPPKTYFSCQNRHYGYYADIQAKCQVFRICANTDLSGEGFAFLCPNGTLFNQKHFVCDWYTNVDCPGSEKYYAKNDELGVTLITHADMMAAVKEIVEYTKSSHLAIERTTPIVQELSAAVPKLSFASGGSATLTEHRETPYDDDEGGNRIVSASSEDAQEVTEPVYYGEGSLTDQRLQQQQQLNELFRSSAEAKISTDLPNYNLKITSDSSGNAIHTNLINAKYLPPATKPSRQYIPANEPIAIRKYVAPLTTGNLQISQSGSASTSREYIPPKVTLPLTKINPAINYFDDETAHNNKLNNYNTKQYYPKDIDVIDPTEDTENIDLTKHNTTVRDIHNINNQSKNSIDNNEIKSIITTMTTTTPTTMPTPIPNPINIVVDNVDKNEEEKTIELQIIKPSFNTSLDNDNYDNNNSENITVTIFPNQNIDILKIQTKLNASNNFIDNKKDSNETNPIYNQTLLHNNEHQSIDDADKSILLLYQGLQMSDVITKNDYDQINLHQNINLKESTTSNELLSLFSINTPSISTENNNEFLITHAENNEDNLKETTTSNNQLISSINNNNTINNWYSYKNGNTRNNNNKITIDLHHHMQRQPLPIQTNLISLTSANDTTTEKNIIDEYNRNDFHKMNQYSKIGGFLNNGLNDKLKKQRHSNIITLEQKHKNFREQGGYVNNTLAEQLQKNLSTIIRDVDDVDLIVKKLNESSVIIGEQEHTQLLLENKTNYTNNNSRQDKHQHSFINNNIRKTFNQINETMTNNDDSITTLTQIKENLQTLDSSNFYQIFIPQKSFNVLKTSYDVKLNFDENDYDFLNVNDGLSLENHNLQHQQSYTPNYSFVSHNNNNNNNHLFSNNNNYVKNQVQSTISSFLPSTSSHAQQQHKQYPSSHTLNVQNHNYNTATTPIAVNFLNSDNHHHDHEYNPNSNYQRPHLNNHEYVNPIINNNNQLLNYYHTQSSSPSLFTTPSTILQHQQQQQHQPQQQHGIVSSTTSYLSSIPSTFNSRVNSQYHTQPNNFNQFSNSQKKYSVEIIPSLSWYLNDDAERKSYFDAVGKGLFGNEGRGRGLYHSTTSNFINSPNEPYNSADNVYDYRRNIHNKRNADPHQNVIRQTRSSLNSRITSTANNNNNNNKLYQQYAPKYL